MEVRNPKSKDNLPQQPQEAQRPAVSWYVLPPHKPPPERQTTVHHQHTWVWHSIIRWVIFGVLGLVALLR